MRRSGFALPASVIVALSSTLCQAQTSSRGLASPGTLVTFDVPGSTCQVAFTFCTQVRAINTAGDTTGFTLTPRARCTASCDMLTEHS